MSSAMVGFLTQGIILSPYNSILIIVFYSMALIGGIQNLMQEDMSDTTTLTVLLAGVSPLNLFAIKALRLWLGSALPALLALPMASALLNVSSAIELLLVLLPLSLSICLLLTTIAFLMPNNQHILIPTITMIPFSVPALLCATSAVLWPTTGHLLSWTVVLVFMAICPWIGIRALTP
jgi:hypothetical protein